MSKNIQTNTNIGRLKVETASLNIPVKNNPEVIDESQKSNIQVLDIRSKSRTEVLNSQVALLPLKLSITIHEVKQLHIRSLSSVEYSVDPFVNISSNNKVLIRSPTLYNTKTNSPVWDFKTILYLLHNHIILKVDLIDENKNKLDKILGTTFINLWEIASNNPLEQAYPIQDCDDKKYTIGYLRLTIHIEKTEPIVKIGVKNQINQNTINVPAKLLTDLIAKLKSLQLEGPFIETITRSQFLPLLTNDTDQFSFVGHCRTLITDILYDCYNLVNGGENRKLLNNYLYSNLYFHHQNYEYTSSCVVEYATSLCSYSSPCKELGIIFNYQGNNDSLSRSKSRRDVSKPFTMLRFPNKYIMWIWVKWLRNCIRYWGGLMDEDELPVWMLEAEYQQIFNNSLQLHYGDEVFKGRFVLSKGVKFQLLYEKFDKDNKMKIAQHSFDLTYIDSLQVSVDSQFPSKYRMEVNSLSLEVPLEMRKQNQGLSFSITLRSTVLHNILEKTEVASDIFQTDTRKPVEFDVSDENKIYFDVDSDAFIEPELDENGAVIPSSKMDIDDNDNSNDLSTGGGGGGGAVARGLTRNRSRDRTASDSIPSDTVSRFNYNITNIDGKSKVIKQIKDATGFHVFVCTTEKGPLRKKVTSKFSKNVKTHTTKLLAHAYVPYADVIKGNVAAELVSLNRSFDDQYKTVEFETAISLDFVHNKSMYVTIKLLDVLMDWPEIVSVGTKTFFFRCSACDWRGDRLNQIPRFDSSGFQLCDHPDVGMFEFALPFNVNWANVAMVKLEVFISHLAVTTHRCGAAFIPIKDFFVNLTDNNNNGVNQEEITNKPKALVNRIAQTYSLVHNTVQIPNKYALNDFHRGTVTVELGFQSTPYNENVDISSPESFNGSSNAVNIAAAAQAALDEADDEDDSTDGQSLNARTGTNGSDSARSDVESSRSMRSASDAVESQSSNKARTLGGRVRAVSAAMSPLKSPPMNHNESSQLAARQKVNLKLNFKSKLAVNTINNNAWPAEVFLANDNVSNISSIELCYVSVGFNGIDVFLTNEVRSCVVDESEVQTEAVADIIAKLSTERKHQIKKMKHLPKLEEQRSGSEMDEDDVNEEEINAHFSGNDRRSSSSTIHSNKDSPSKSKQKTIVSGLWSAVTRSGAGGEAKKGSISASSSSSRNSVSKPPVPEFQQERVFLKVPAVEKKTKSSSAFSMIKGALSAVVHPHAKPALTISAESNDQPSILNVNITQSDPIKAIFQQNKDKSAAEEAKQKKDEEKKLRYDTYSKNKGIVLLTCKERESMSEDIASFSWNQILSVNPITSSVCSITLAVTQYHGKDFMKGDEIYHTSVMQLFVLNCPALGFFKLINERQNFVDLRQEIKSVYQLSKKVDLKQKTNEERDLSDKLYSYSVGIFKELNDDAIVLESALIELRRNAMSKSTKLDDFVVHANYQMKKEYMDIIELSTRCIRIRMYVATLIVLNSFKPVAEKLAVAPGFYEYNYWYLKRHNFEFLSSANMLIDNDFGSARKLVKDNTLDTISSQIEFLINQAEKHIINASLRGWNSVKKQDNKNYFEVFFETIVNEFLVEIAALFEQFFEDSSVIRSIKGLQNKTKLILAFATCNDRLDQILKQALRPYNRKVSQPAYFSIYFNLDRLFSLYVAIVQQEMTATIEEVTQFWGDATKDASGTRAKYSLCLPWFPMRIDGNSGVFLTNIPEDVRRKLLIYIEVARLKKAEVSKSVVHLVDSIDGKLLLIFTSAFMKLVDTYWKAMCSDQWLGKLNEVLTDRVNDQYEEKVEWFCSVANDCYRVSEELIVLELHEDGGHDAAVDIDNYELEQYNTRMHRPSLRKVHSSYMTEASNRKLATSNMTDATVFTKTFTTANGSKETGIVTDAQLDKLRIINRKLNKFKVQRKQISNVKDAVLDQAYTFYSATTAKSLEFVASIMFRVLFVGDKEWLGVSCHSTWLQEEVEGPDMHMATAVETSFQSGLNDIEYWLNAHRSYLYPLSFFRLVVIVSERVVLRYIHMLKMARLSRRYIEMDGVEIAQLEADIDCLKTKFSKVLTQSPDTIEYLDSLLISQPFRYLDIILTLLQTSFGSRDFMKALQQLNNFAASSPPLAKAMGNFAETVILLRADTSSYGTSLYNNPAPVPPTGSSQGIKKGFFSSMFSASVTAMSSHASQTRSIVASKSSNDYASAPGKRTSNKSRLPKRYHPKFNENLLLSVLDQLDDIKSNDEFISDAIAIQTSVSNNRNGDSRSLLATIFSASCKEASHSKVDSETVYLELCNIFFNEKLTEDSKPTLHSLNDDTANSSLLSKGHNSNKDRSDSSAAASDDGLSTDTNFLKIQVSDIKLLNMPANSKKIKPYLTISFGDVTKTTEIAQPDLLFNSPNAASSVDDPKNSSSSAVSTAAVTTYLIAQNLDFLVKRGGFSLSDLHCDLFVRGKVYGVDKVGYLDISSANLQAVDIESQSFTFTAMPHYHSTVSGSASVGSGLNSLKDISMPALNVTIRLLNRFSN